MDYLLFLAGLALLTVGGDRLVASAVRIGRNFGLSTLAIGVVVLGFGTSMPEMATSVDAAWQGFPGAALGNVIGSNIANILLVLGLGALWAPMRVDVAPARRDLPWLIGTSLAVLGLVQFGVVERWMGAVLVIGLVVYIWRALQTDVRPAAPASGSSDAEGQPNPDDSLAPSRLALESVIALVALAALVAGAHVLVLGATGIAAGFGISESVTGLVLLALGTSLPELTVTVVALIRGEADVAIGNVVGSTLFNLLGILGVTALLVPLPVPASIATVHIWVMLGAVVIAALFIRTDWHLRRWEGGVLLAAYPVYLVALLV